MYDITIYISHQCVWLVGSKYVWNKCNINIDNGAIVILIKFDYITFFL